jgi:hypothetical protein
MALGDAIVWLYAQGKIQPVRLNPIAWILDTRLENVWEKKSTYWYYWCIAQAQPTLYFQSSQYNPQNSSISLMKLEKAPRNYKHPLKWNGWCQFLAMVQRPSLKWHSEWHSVIVIAQHACDETASRRWHSVLEMRQLPCNSIVSWWWYAYIQASVQISTGSSHTLLQGGRGYRKRTSTRTRPLHIVRQNFSGWVCKDCVSILHCPSDGALESCQAQAVLVPKDVFHRPSR